MNLRKLLSAFLVFALMCTLFVPCVSAQESTREIPFALYKECRVSCFYTDINHELYLVKSREELDSVLDLVDQNDVTSVLPESERDVKYTDAFFEKKAVIIGLYTFGSGSYRHSIENLFVTGDTLYVSRSVFFPEMGTCDEQCRFALMEVALSDIEGVTTVEDFFPGDVIVAEIKSVYGLRGDTDNDDKINVRDATLVQKSLVSLHSFSSADELKADANADGEISIRDATEIQKYSAGFELNSPIGYLVEVLEEYDHTEPTEPTEFTDPTQTYLQLQQALEELYEMIERARWDIEPGSNFLAETVRRLREEQEKAEALYESENPDYDEVVAQTLALEAAIEGLEYVQLDTSALVPLMNEAERIIDAGGYTEESLDRLNEAMFMGQMACLYGQSQDEVTEAINAIEDAIAKLEPLYDNRERSIGFTVVEEGRVSYYGTENPVLYLVKSPEQMDEILATIDSEDWDGYIQPVRDEKYNEAFFENKSLIISLNVVGGGNCYQSIDDVIVKGNVLTVYRTIYQPMWPTPDMNYQYVLIEVNNIDIRGVTTVTDSDSAHDSQPEYITVYFENKLEWTDVNIHYWSDTYNTTWPGEPMNILCHSLNGYELYSFEIPSDTNGIVFASSVDGVQTEDMVTLFDDMLCYPTNMTASNRWNVWAVDINDVDIFPQPPTEEPTIPPAPAEIDIEFTVLQECRVQGWGELYVDEELEVYIVESAEQMDEVLSRIRGEVTDQWEPRPARDEKYNDEYFAENSLIIALVPLGSGSYTQDVKKITVEDNVLTIHTYINTPFASTCDMNYRYLLIEVKSDAVTDVEAFDYTFEYRYIGEE